MKSIPKEVEDKLEHWDLFVKDGYILTTGKSWPRSLNGNIATYFDNKWIVRTADSFEVCKDELGIYIGWPNTDIEIDNDKFIEYMNLVRDIVTHMNYVAHLVELIGNLKNGI